MTTIKVEGMHCEKCVERIHKAMEKASLTGTVSLENHTVEVDGCEQCVKTMLEILDDLGFDGAIQN